MVYSEYCFRLILNEAYKNLRNPESNKRGIYLDWARLFRTFPNWQLLQLGMHCSLYVRERSFITWEFLSEYWELRIMDISKCVRIIYDKLFFIWVLGLTILVLSCYFCCGPMVLWSYGPMVLWSCDTMILWSYSPVILGPAILWFSCDHSLIITTFPGLTHRCDVKTPSVVTSYFTGDWRRLLSDKVWLKL